MGLVLAGVPHEKAGLQAALDYLATANSGLAREEAGAQSLAS